MRWPVLAQQMPLFVRSHTVRCSAFTHRTCSAPDPRATCGVGIAVNSPACTPSVPGLTHSGVQWGGQRKPSSTAGQAAPVAEPSGGNLGLSTVPLALSKLPDLTPAARLFQVRRHRLGAADCSTAECSANAVAPPTNVGQTAPEQRLVLTMHSSRKDQIVGSPGAFAKMDGKPSLTEASGGAGRKVQCRRGRGEQEQPLLPHAAATPCARRGMAADDR